MASGSVGLTPRQGCAYSWEASRGRPSGRSRTTLLGISPEKGSRGNRGDHVAPKTSQALQARSSFCDLPFPDTQDTRNLGAMAMGRFQGLSRVRLARSAFPIQAETNIVTKTKGIMNAHKRMRPHLVSTCVRCRVCKGRKMSRDITTLNRGLDDPM